MGKEKSTTPALMITGQPVKGTVKFFNADKGYGFITPDGHYQDVFVHMKQVQASGLTGLREEDKVNFVVATDQQRQDRTFATSIELIESKSEQRAAVKAGRSDTGTVKWFNDKKGYGFIAPEDGGKDVFVHISAVEAAGLELPIDGKQVAFIPREGRDGRMLAGEIALI